jgi:5'-3' exonuclease
LLLGVKPVFVLEGTAPSLKHDTMSQRVQQRRKNRKQNTSSDEDSAKVCEHTRARRKKGCRSQLDRMLKQVCL